MRFESLSRHPDSGIFLLRKQVPERLKEAVGKREIKLSLRTRDPVIARIRHLELLAKIERDFAGIDAAIVDGEPNAILSASFQGPPRYSQTSVAVAAPARSEKPHSSVRWSFRALSADALFRMVTCGFQG